MAEQNKKIFFLHIPKTAGYTFHHILFRQYPFTKHAIVHSVQRTPKYQALSAAKKRNTGVVRGHFVFGLHRQPGDEGICLTFLRDPFLRTISGYEFIYSNPKHPFHRQMTEQAYTLYDFLDRKLIANFDNIQVRFLCGDNSMPFGTVNEMHLEKAWQNLLSSDVLFGLTERFDETVLYFKHHLALPEPYYERLNVTQNRRIDPGKMDEKTKQKIAEVNRYDIELYNRAKKLFDERINAMGEGFADEVKRFQEKNRQFREPSSNLFRKIRNVMRIRIMP